MDDIKKIKEEEKQEVLEEEAKDVKAGKMEVEVKPAEPEVLEETKPKAAEPAKPAFKNFGGSSGGRRGGAGGGRRGGRRDDNKEHDEFEQKIVDLARVTRVMAGGKRMRFRACVVIGDKKGRVGLGLAKGQDVTMAISKAVAKAKKDLVVITFINDTIPFAVREKFKASQILLKPAQKGKGIIAGGALRIVFEMAGVPNIISKILGTSNQVTNAKAAINALRRFTGINPASKRIAKQAKAKVEETKKD